MFKVKRFRQSWALKAGGGAVLEWPLEKRAAQVMADLTGAGAGLLKVGWFQRWKRVIAVWPVGKTAAAQKLITHLVHGRRVLLIGKPLGGTTWGAKRVTGRMLNVDVWICEDGIIENIRWPGEADAVRTNPVVGEQPEQAGVGASGG
jgi:hypothetical protein